MRIPLGILGLATLSSWLLISPFSKILQESYSSGILDEMNLSHLVLEVSSNPSTWIVFVMIIGGAMSWFIKDRLGALERAVSWLGRAAAASFGFEWINQKIVLGLNRTANALRATQTGVLNWNVFGIAAGLLAVLIYLMLWN
jgi:NADH-quinone oxidoreductase subunit L